MTEEDKNRIKAIRGKVDLLEQLHKTCQLSNIGLLEPILNETRYLARSLADLLYFQDDEQKVLLHLGRAELAAHSAINDAIDSLITYVKKTLLKLKETYSFDIVSSDFYDDYLSTLRAIQKIDDLVVYSRGHRTERLAIYSQLAAEETLLKQVAGFALKLPQIECIAQINERNKLQGGAPEDDSLIARHIQGALSDNHYKDATFSLFLQPKYRISDQTRTLIGAEALLRFKIGEAQISPTQFIKIAERTKLIEPLGKMVLLKALDVLRLYPAIPCISVNISAIELASPTYSEELLSLLTTEGVAKERLELEITEGTVIRDIHSEEHLKKIAHEKIGISIDDFGTGETRFDYLAKFPINVIKIDMSLVQKFRQAPKQYTKLIQAISAVGKVCDLGIIAEGVETEDDVRNLSALGICDFQGYFFGRPVPITDFIATHLPSASVAQGAA